MKVALVLQRLRLAHNYIPLLCQTCQPESPERPSIMSRQRIRPCPIPSSFGFSAIQHILVNHHALIACSFPVLSDTQLFCPFRSLHHDNMVWVLTLEKPWWTAWSTKSLVEYLMPAHIIRIALYGLVLETQISAGVLCLIMSWSK